MLKLKVSIKMQFYKKSQIVLKYIFVAILMVLIFYSFAEGGKSRGEKIDQFKLGIAKDIALLVNTLYSTNGDVKYIYQNNFIYLKLSSCFCFKNINPSRISSALCGYVQIDDKST